MSYSLAEDRSLTGPGPWTLDYWPADPRGNHVQCFMWALWGVCVCGQNSNPRDGSASILLTESSSQPTFYLHVCVVYVHLIHICVRACVWCRLVET